MRISDWSSDVCSSDLPNSPIPQAMTSFLSDPVVQPFDTANEDHSVRAIMGRITSSGSSYLVTAGTDKNIRFWDFHNTSKCYTISGLLPGKPKHAFHTPRVCYFFVLHW